MVNLSTGLPFNITTGFDNNGDTVANDREAGVGRNDGRGPGSVNLDIRLGKRLRLGMEKRRRDVELAVDGFNVLNHVNFMNFVGTMSSPVFGRANAAYPARQLQVSLRFTF